LIKKLNDINQKMINHRWVKGTLDWSKTRVLPGTGGVTFFEIGKFIWEESKKEGLTTRANSIAFSLFLGIFPFIIFLFTLLPYLPITEDYTLALSNSTKNVLPKNAHAYLMEIIHDITMIKRGGLLSIGFLFALYFASNGVLSLMKGFDKSYKEHFAQRSIWFKRLIALLIVIVLGAIAAGSISFFVFSRYVFALLDGAVNTTRDDKIFYFIYDFLKVISVIGLVIIAVNSIYYFGPSFRKKLPFFNIGSLVASSLILISSLVFAFFINNFGKFNEVYGSIGALIVILLWIKINSFILLVGFELNAAIAVNRKK
jgi:membrane protein